MPGGLAVVGRGLFGDLRGHHVRQQQFCKQCGGGLYGFGDRKLLPWRLGCPERHLYSESMYDADPCLGRGLLGQFRGHHVWQRQHGGQRLGRL